MKRLAFIMALVAMAGCSKGEEKPAAAVTDTASMSSDTSHMMSDSAHAKMADSSKK